MEITLGTRIAALRKKKGMKQDEIAEILNVSAQAVSKWENDQTCPDITLLPKLAEILNVSVDELLSGKREPDVKILPPEERKDVKDMILRVMVDSSDGDRIRVNLPLQLIQVAIELGIETPQISGDKLQNIDWKSIMELVSHGVVGNLVEVDSSDGDVIRVFVE